MNRAAVQNNYFAKGMIACSLLMIAANSHSETNLLTPQRETAIDSVRRIILEHSKKEEAEDTFILKQILPKGVQEFGPWSLHRSSSLLAKSLAFTDEQISALYALLDDQTRTDFEIFDTRYVSNYLLPNWVNDNSNFEVLEKEWFMNLERFRSANRRRLTVGEVSWHLLNLYWNEPASFTTWGKGYALWRFPRNPQMANMRKLRDKDWTEKLLNDVRHPRFQAQNLTAYLLLRIRNPRVASTLTDFPQIKAKIDKMSLPMPFGGIYYGFYEDFRWPPTSIGQTELRGLESLSMLHGSTQLPKNTMVKLQKLSDLVRSQGHSWEQEFWFHMSQLGIRGEGINSD